MGSFISWLNKFNTGSSPSSSTTPSIWGMVDTLVPVLLTCAVYILIFLIMRKTQKRFYAPRTYLGSMREHERSPSMPDGWFNWIGAFSKVPDAYALQHQSLDAYLFLRFLRICFVIAFVSLCITWPILFPINATGGGGQKQLEILSYSNINIAKNPNRLYAHCLVGWVVYGFVLYMILRECIFYINLRQAFLLTPQYAKRISSRTVLFTCVPGEYIDTARMRQIFTDSVKNVWLAGNPKDLDELVGERDKAAFKLEKAEIKLLKTVNKERIKAFKKSGGPPPAEMSETVEGDEQGPHDPEGADIASRWITDKKRPSHRLGKFGLYGKKVDTIHWARTELETLVPKTEAAQADWIAGNFKPSSSVFVEFHTQSDAQAAFQVLTHHAVLQMAPKFIGVKPEDVIWKNLNLPWWQKIVRRYSVYVFIILLVIFWAIPVGIVGVISSVGVLEKIPGLTWLKDIPEEILGVISGLLPSIALSILMSLVPVFMRMFGRFAGEISMSRVELFTQNGYFFFQIVQVFLIRTITNSASSAIVEISKDPADVFNLLSSALPASSDFYISYFIVQGLTIAVGVVTQVVGLFVFRILYKFLATTPRAMFKKWTTLASISWGSTMPVYTNIAVISITYSVIAPLMLFWSSIGLGLFYLAYRYNILFVSDTTIDTRGLIYPRALKQLFTGVYLAEVCMVGLFAISKAAGPAALMAVFLIFTILFQLTMQSALDPLLYSLPRTLQIEEELIRGRTDPSSAETGEAGKNGANGASKRLTGLFSGQQEGGVQKKGNFFMKFLKPWFYADYETLRKLVPHEDSFGIEYLDGVEENAYWPPSVTSAAPILWIPRDPLGLSKHEIAESSKVIPISDEGATLDEKNKVTWDTEGARPPIWNEKVYY